MADNKRPVGSRLLHAVETGSQSPVASTVAAIVSLIFLTSAIIAKDPAPWLTAFAGIAESVVVVMVFTLQHTQSRQQAALQRKLDEILQALPGADNRVVRVESASEGELERLEEGSDQVRKRAITKKGPPPKKKP